MCSGARRGKRAGELAEGAGVVVPSLAVSWEAARGGCLPGCSCVGSRGGMMASNLCTICRFFAACPDRFSARSAVCLPKVEICNRLPLNAESL